MFMVKRPHNGTLVSLINRFTCTQRWFGLEETGAIRIGEGGAESVIGCPIIYVPSATLDPIINLS